MITLFDRICYTEVGSEITHDGGQFWENNWSLSLYNDIIIGNYWQMTKLIFINESNTAIKATKPDS